MTTSAIYVLYFEELNAMGFGGLLNTDEYCQAVLMGYLLASFPLHLTTEILTALKIYDYVTKLA